MGIRPADRNLNCIPLGHSYGLGSLVMPLLLQGTLAIAANTFLPREILALIAEHGVTVLPIVPVVLRALAQLDDATALPSLRLIISAGGPLAPDVAQEFLRRYGVRIHNFYGSTETGGICYDRTGNAALTGRAIGKPLRGVNVRVRRDGRVIVQSPAVAAPRRRIVLADVGRWTAAGELQLLGRANPVANIGGKKVTPAEIEMCLRALTGVSDVWVTVLHDKHGNDYLAAAVETKRRRANLEKSLMRCLPAWKLPKRYFLRPALPRTARGKIDSVYLRARLSTTLP